MGFDAVRYSNNYVGVSIEHFLLGRSWAPGERRSRSWVIIIAISLSTIFFVPCRLTMVYGAGFKEVS